MIAPSFPAHSPKVKVSSQMISPSNIRHRERRKQKKKPCVLLCVWPFHQATAAAAGMARRDDFVICTRSNNYDAISFFFFSFFRVLFQFLYDFVGEHRWLRLRRWQRFPPVRALMSTTLSTLYIGGRRHRPSCSSVCLSSTPPSHPFLFFLAKALSHMKLWSFFFH